MSLKGLLNQSISLYSASDYDEWGKPTLGSATAYKARVEESTRTKLLPNGTTITIDATAILNGDVDISIDDRLDYDGKYYKIIAVKKGVDGEGNIVYTRADLVQKVY